MNPYRIALACLSLICLGLSACGETTALSRLDKKDEETGATAVNGASRTSLGELYVLGSNDTIEVTVYNHDDLSGKFIIGTEGRISVPLIGEVDAAGETVQSLAGEIEARFRDGYLRNPQVSVQVIEYRPFYIFGSVQKPGDYEYQNNMTVLSAIAIAGGYAENANEGSRVMVIRSTDKSRSPVAVGLTAPIYPGDIVEVPRAGVGPVPGR